MLQKWGGDVSVADPALVRMCRARAHDVGGDFVQPIYIYACVNGEGLGYNCLAWRLVLYLYLTHGLQCRMVMNCIQEKTT